MDSVWKEVSWSEIWEVAKNVSLFTHERKNPLCIWVINLPIILTGMDIQPEIRDSNPCRIWNSPELRMGEETFSVIQSPIVLVCSESLMGCLPRTKISSILIGWCWYKWCKWSNWHECCLEKTTANGWYMLTQPCFQNRIGSASTTNNINGTCFACFFRGSSIENIWKHVNAAMVHCNRTIVNPSSRLHVVS
jgi:hypothetical protein